MTMTVEVFERSTRTWHFQDLTAVSLGHISGWREDFAQEVCAPVGFLFAHAGEVADAVG